MRYVLFMLGVCLLLGCAKEEPPPPVTPPPEDLSTWAVPELVQAPQEEPPAPRDPPAEKPTAAEKVYAYIPGATFAVQVSTSAPLDLVLDREEQVRNIVEGDRAPSEPTPPLAQGEVRATVPSEAPSQGRRWEVREGASGLGETLRPHIFIAASEAGLSTGVIVTTTKRTYLLDLKSVRTSPIRVVRWTYPHEAGSKEREARSAKHESGLLPDPQEPRQYHVGYSLEGGKPDWRPRQILDDGKKTYILYSEVALFETVPMLRLIGANGPALVNAKQ